MLLFYVKVFVSLFMIFEVFFHVFSENSVLVDWGIKRSWRPFGLSLTFGQWDPVFHCDLLFSGRTVEELGIVWWFLGIIILFLHKTGLIWSFTYLDNFGYVLILFSLFMWDGIFSFYWMITLRLTQALLIGLEVELGWVLSPVTINVTVIALIRVFVVPINHPIQLMGRVLVKFWYFSQRGWLGIEDDFLLIWLAFMNGSELKARGRHMHLMRVEDHFLDKRFFLWWVEVCLLCSLVGLWVHLWEAIPYWNLVYSFWNTFLL